MRHLLNFGFITFLVHFFQIVTSFISLWFLLFFKFFSKISLAQNAFIFFPTHSLQLLFAWYSVPKRHPITLPEPKNQKYFFWFQAILQYLIQIFHMYFIHLFVLYILHSFLDFSEFPFLCYQWQLVMLFVLLFGML